MAASVFAGIAFVSQAAFAAPAKVIAMRHAEKTTDENNPNLSKEGYARSQKLPDFILEKFGKPDFLIATAGTDKSNRPFLTLIPLAEKTGLSTDNSMDTDDIRVVRERIMSDSKYDGKFVVIAWHHKNIPHLLRLMGAPLKSYPDPWPDDLYNLIIELKYDGKSPTVQQIQEPF